ncbi:hypothetical protein Mal4_55860 [Maioricimonas rarisocia]|uniref:Uncharacterized protein n=1 Tax=Maioricimonas rarisocia TaxID=2528026 RepID=A0A517ZFH9_9PLAN|nr:hypothetical protein [Maioricimonas rarisocia]QDU41221.1 hypothetical protein Mal4_55860 [Maioricimonas rarisocia]
MSEDSADEPLVIECFDRDHPGGFERRIAIDVDRRVVTFINCLWPRRFLVRGYEPQHTCPFDDVLEARDFGAGELRRLVIATRTGRCAVSADWIGFEELREALQKIASVTESGSAMDNPGILIPTMVVVIFGIVGGVIWMLL